MLSSVEQAFVGRDEKRVALKTPTWEAKEVAETSRMVVEDWDYDPLMVNVSHWCTHHDGDDDYHDDSDAAL